MRLIVSAAFLVLFSVMAAASECDDTIAAYNATTDESAKIFDDYRTKREAVPMADYCTPAKLYCDEEQAQVEEQRKRLALSDRMFDVCRAGSVVQILSGKHVTKTQSHNQEQGALTKYIGSAATACSAATIKEACFGPQVGPF